MPLLSIQGKFLLSYNDDAFVRELYDRPGIFLMETTRINNIKQRYDNGCQFPELIIANYDLQERSRTVPSQMTLFDGTEVIYLNEHPNELEKLQKAALLIEEMSMGRLKVCPSVVGHVYIRPEQDAYIGLQMQIVPDPSFGAVYRYLYRLSPQDGNGTGCRQPAKS